MTERTVLRVDLAMIAGSLLLLAAGVMAGKGFATVVAVLSLVASLALLSMRPRGKK